MLINIAICDDQPIFVHQLENLIISFNNWDGYNYKIHKYSSGKKLISELRNGFYFDLVFLDIELENKLSGTEIGTFIKNIHPNTLIIYVSSYQTHFKEMVNAEPFLFLSKPLEQNDIDNALNKVIYRFNALNNEFIYEYKSNGILYLVKLKDVVYFESMHRIIIIHHNDGTISKFYEKLDNVENDVSKMVDYFLRVNKSYYVNYYYIEHMSNSHVSINNQEISIGSKYKNDILRKILYLE